VPEGERQRLEYLHQIEVKLWVEERELEALRASASQEVRAEVEREIARLRALAQALRAELEFAPQSERGGGS
jgi:serine phosphatase RsbU (regulator of sigma subunit)